VDRLTAYRTFGNPGYSPVRGKVRIYSNRWYFCTFQNVEHNPLIDYIGLAQGEYTELLPGEQARGERDSRLNHLNSMREHRGEVWQVTHPTHSGRKSWHPTQDGARRAVAAQLAEDARKLAEARASLAKQIARTDEELAGYALCNPPMSPVEFREWQAGMLPSCEAFYAQEPTIKQLR